MTGMPYVIICCGFGLAAGIIGKLKGSIFWIWFIVGGLVPFLGLAAALFYRDESNEPDIACPACGRRCKVYDAVCMRCGYELEFAQMTAEATDGAATPSR